MNARRLVLTVFASVCPFVGAGLLAEPALAQGACPNEALRTGFNASLPECRAYELVSPAGTAPQIEQGEGRAGASKDMYRGVRLPGQPVGVNVSASGERLAFYSNYAPSGSVSDSQYFMASSGPDGWSTSSLVPPQSPEYTIVCHNGYAVAYSTELTSWVLGDGWGQAESGHGLEGCGKDDPELVQGESQDFQNLFVSEGLNASYKLIDVTPEKVQPTDAWFQAASSDLAHVVFDEKAKLTPEAPAGDDFYVWSAGATPAVRLVTVLPDGTPTAGALVNRDEDEANGKNEGLYYGDTFFYKGPEIFTHAVSSDASRVFFYANGALYVRENAYADQSALVKGDECTEPEKACTVQIDASQTGGGGGGSRFLWASADGSRVFFSDTQRLTSDSTAVAEKPDLYEYDFEAPEGQRLTDLTVDASEPADVLGVSGASEDGSYVYFIADGKLTSVANSHGDTAEPGEPNLYVAHSGGAAFIATLDPTYDNMDWDQKVLTARVSPDGRFIAFDSQRELTGYDNTPPEPADCQGSQGPCTEIFLYDAQEKQLSCVSCDPTGAQPTAPAEIGEPVGHEMDNNTLTNQNAPGYLGHNVTDQGQVFFSTLEPLSPRATNGLVNAYEYSSGEPHLLSTATSDVDAYFYEASPSGNDVFLTTSQPLVAGAEGSEYSIYDARVDGGFTPVERATACSEEDCRGALTPTPLLGAPSSQTFAGTGNPVYAPPAHKAVERAKPNKKKKKHAKGKHPKRRGGKRKGKQARRATRTVRRDRGGVR
jgi:hypothetical protein